MDWRIIVWISLLKNINHFAIFMLTLTKNHIQRIMFVSFATWKWENAIKFNRFLHLAARLNGSIRDVWWDWPIQLDIFSNVQNATTFRNSVTCALGVEFLFLGGKQHVLCEHFLHIFSRLTNDFSYVTDFNVLSHKVQNVVFSEINTN